MKIKYLAALAAASVVGMTALTGCGGDTTEADDPAATTEVTPDAAADPGADTDGNPATDAAPDPTMEKEANPCAPK